MNRPPDPAPANADLERRATELCGSPTGCVFLLLAEASLLGAETVADPSVAVQIAAQAAGKTIYFRVGHEWTVATAMAEGKRLLPLARSVLGQPGAPWWFAPLDRAAQEWLGPTDANPPVLDGATQQATPPSEWERFVQQPSGTVVTSTSVGNPTAAISSAASALRYHSGDYHMGNPPLVRYRLHAATNLRVFEIDSPLSWHALCVRYPVPTENGQLIPDWGQFAVDWDAIHLSLGGLLTADQVRVQSNDGWTELRIWEFEQTHWLRWHFNAIERLPDVVTLDDATLDLPTPPALELPHGVGQSVPLIPRT